MLATAANSIGRQSNTFTECTAEICKLIITTTAEGTNKQCIHWNSNSSSNSMNRVLLARWLDMKWPIIFVTQFHYQVQERPSLNCNLSQLNPVHKLTFYFPKIHFNIPLIYAYVSKFVSSLQVFQLKCFFLLLFLPSMYTVKPVFISSVWIISPQVSFIFSGPCKLPIWTMYNYDHF